jgi:hypothetical protein
VEGERGERQVNEAEALVVRRIFRVITSTMTMTMIMIMIMTTIMVINAAVVSQVEPFRPGMSSVNCMLSND